MTRMALAIEDEAFVVHAFQRGLRRWGWQVQQAACIADARRKLAAWSTQSYAAVIIDVGLPDGDGTTLIREIERLDPRPVLVVVSGTLHAPHEIELQRQSIKFCSKPVEMRELAELIQLAEQAQPLTTADDPIVGYCDTKCLSERETEALSHALERRSRAETGDRMGCSKHAVDGHFRRILRKAGLTRFEHVLLDLIQSLRWEVRALREMLSTTSAAQPPMLGDRGGGGGVFAIH